MKLLIALMYTNKEVYDRCIGELKKVFGETDKESDEYSFNFTAYYEEEMGKNLKKRFVSFKKTISNEELAGIRIKTGKIEDNFRVDNKRIINIDPGYISKEGVFMASIKQKPFKTELENKVFLHKVLGFEENKIIEFKHTFADYKLKENQRFFLDLLYL
jgi:hypothetical protein